MTGHDERSVNRAGTETEVQAALVLRAEPGSARHFLHLLLPLPEQRHLRADGTAVRTRRRRRIRRASAFQRESHPRPAWRDIVNFALGYLKISPKS